MFKLHAISRRDGGDLDGIHLLWSPPYPTGYALKGFKIERRLSEDQKRYACFEVFPGDLDRARAQGFTDIAEARIWASPTNQKKPASAPWCYRFELRRAHHELRLTSVDAICAFAAHADGTVIDGRAFSSSACRLTGAGISIVWLVVKTPRAPIRICGDLSDPKVWEGALTLVEGLQVPFQTVNPDLADVDAERALAKERAQPEPLNGDFLEVSQYGNAAYAKPFQSAAWRVITNDPAASRSRWDTTPLGFVLAAGTIEPAWRRGLGFAFHDKEDLIDGGVYDYRISGLVPREDRDVRRLGFHTVPRGLALPRYFRLGDLGVICDPRPVVEALEAQGDALVAVWKGIRCARVRLLLPEPTARIALDGHSDDSLDVTGFLGALPIATLSEPVSGRTVFDFGVPVDEVVIKGACFLTDFMPQPLPVGLDPEEPVEVSETVRRVAFMPTAPPDPPTDLEVENLGSALRAARRKKRDDTRGFEISWMPPLRMDMGILPWWPDDAQTAPPTDVASYVLERQWDGGPFVPPPGTKGAQVSSRNADPRTEAIAPGADLLAIYPTTDKTGIANEARVRAIDGYEGDNPAFGTFITYGVSSVDALGRRSARALAPPEQLQKLIRPPVPVAPPETALTAEAVEDVLIAPSGVQARLLQSSDPDLTPTERARVDAEGDIVVLRWGWGPVQRGLDPNVTEFRVYEAAGKLAEITATVTGPPTALASGGWRLACSFSRPVEANEFAGSTVTLGLAFEIESHGASSSGNVDLKPAVADPSRSPVGTVLTLIRIDGSDEDPARWDSRVLVVPRTPDPTQPDATEGYEIALPATWITVSPSSRRQDWSFGVSAADSESYVADRRAAIDPAPRAGNESPVSGAVVVARYRGRPNLSITDLGPVASLSLDRADAAGVYLDFAPADYLPSGASALSRMRIERAPASAALRRLIVDESGICLRDRTGAETPWALSPSDEAALRSEHAARAVSDRFLAHAAARLTDLNDAFEKIADANPSHSLRDLLPNSPARWIYRVRAVDAGGMPSAEAQVLELVVRVPRPVRAVVPELVDLTLAGGTATVTVSARDAAGDGQLFLVHRNDTRVQTARAELATVRNRPELADEDRFFVRDDRQNLLTLTLITPGADGTATADFTVPDGHHFHVWAFAVSGDGVPSRLIGPLHAMRGLPAEDS